MERSTIKLEVSLINKIKEIQALNGYKSVNETVKHILPQGTVTPETYKNVSWDELKKAEIGKTWINNEEATIIYKDEIGALIRFVDAFGEVYLNYFHFL